MEWLSGGDMVWWDNRYLLYSYLVEKRVNFVVRQSLHRANPYTEQMTARDVRRSTVIDDGPLAFGVTIEERVAAGWAACEKTPS
jgi:alpha-ketoglutarate-dependent 2,4-dichlorophenoxyacetate dioxygenase